MAAYHDISEYINSLPLIDIHTHMDLSHLSARGLHDVLLYHMMISELYSAGCPDGARLSEYPDEAEAQSRLLAAIPYLPHIRYTSTYSIAKRILSDLYDINDKITLDNWEAADKRIKERYQQGYADDILKKANIIAVNTEYCRKHGLHHPKFFYSMEWAFFTRNQYGIFDAPLTELEVAVSQDAPEGPIPVTIDEALYTDRKRLTSVEAVDEAVSKYVSMIPFDQIVSLPTHFSSDIRYGSASKTQMAAALKNRSIATAAERDIYANYINNKYFKQLEKNGKGAAVAISIGAEPLHFETASKLNADTLYAIESLAARYPTIDFIIFNGNDYHDNTLLTIIRETQNVYAAGFWWHNFYPGTITQIISNRLDRIPLNKWFGYFSDAYCADWAYGKSLLIKDCFARALAAMMDQNRLSFDDAAYIAGRLLYQNAKDYFNL